MLQLTVQNGAKLLPDVPEGTGGTKSKSKFGKCRPILNKVVRSMRYLPRRARVPHPPNKFRHFLKIG